MFSVPRNSSFNPPVNLRNGIPRGCLKIRIYMMHHLCKILNVKWQQHIPNKFILEKSKLPGTCNIYLSNATKDGLATWTDLRMADYQIDPVFSLREGSHRTKFQHKDIMKRDLGVINILLDEWQYLSKNRNNWRKRSSGCLHWIQWTARGSSSSSSSSCNSIYK